MTIPFSADAVVNLGGKNEGESEGEFRNSLGNSHFCHRDLQNGYSVDSGYSPISIETTGCGGRPPGQNRDKLLSCPSSPKPTSSTSWLAMATAVAMCRQGLSGLVNLFGTVCQTNLAGTFYYGKV